MGGTYVLHREDDLARAGKLPTRFDCGLAEAQGDPASVQESEPRDLTLDLQAQFVAVEAQRPRDILNSQHHDTHLSELVIRLCHFVSLSLADDLLRIESAILIEDFLP